MDIVTFDIPYANIDDLFGWLIAVSEDNGIYPGEEETYEPLIERLGMFGYDSRFLSLTTETVYLNFIATIIVYVFLVVSRPCIRGGTCHKRRIKTKNAYCWTVLIRIVLELTLELCFCLIMSLSFSKASNVHNALEGYDLVLTYVLSVMVFGGPIFILIFFCLNYERLTTDNVLEEHEIKQLKEAE